MELPKQIKTLIPTTEVRGTLLAEIELLRKSLYQVGSGFEQTLQKNLRSESAAALSQFLQKDKTREQKEASLNELKEALLKLPLLHLTIAVAPSASGIDTITEKARTYFGADVVLDIVIDPALYGGAEVSYEGRYVDLSLKSKMDDYFAKRKNQKFQ